LLVRMEMILNPFPHLAQQPKRTIFLLVLSLFLGLPVGCHNSTDDKTTHKDKPNCDPDTSVTDGTADASDSKNPNGSSADGSTPRDGEEPEPNGSEQIEITHITVFENPNNALSYFVEWETDVPADTVLNLSCEKNISHTYKSAKLTTFHSVFVMGLLENIHCDLMIESHVSQCSGAASATIERVGSVPSFLPALKARVIDPERIQPGWTMWSFGQFSGSGPAYIIITDQRGRYRWYDLESTDRRYADHELLIIPEGILLGGSATKILNWEGEVLWEAPFNGHHDITISSFNDNHFLYLGVSSEGCRTTEGTANEFDRATQRTIWTWRICEHFTPRLDYNNWSHVNTIEPFPGERALLISTRDQNALLKIDRDTDEIVWILGEGGDFEMDASDRFLRQHAPEIQPNGNILLFDNGLSLQEASRAGNDGADRVREYSRALELALIFDKQGKPLRAEKVWEYKDESLFSPGRSEADRLANGNTLIIYSTLREDDSSLIREVTHDGEVIWELRAPPDRSSYRVERIKGDNYGYVRDVAD